MSRQAVTLSIGGQQYRVVAGLEDKELQRLATIVESHLPRSTAGRSNPQALLLAALSLAHELDEERSRNTLLESKSRDTLRRILLRIDDALANEEGRDEAGDVSRETSEPVGDGDSDG